MLMHVSRFAADEGFGGFDLAGHFVPRPHAQREPNAMIEEPSGLLSDANGPVNLIAADSIFAVHNLPHGRQPLVQADRRILHDGSDLSR
jgi:hypothetical protein